MQLMASNAFLQGPWQPNHIQRPCPGSTDLRTEAVRDTLERADPGSAPARLACNNHCHICSNAMFDEELLLQINGLAKRIRVLLEVSRLGVAQTGAGCAMTCQSPQNARCRLVHRKSQTSLARLADGRGKSPCRSQERPATLDHQQLPAI